MVKPSSGEAVSSLAQEVKIWNTPVLGAYLLWRFTCGHCAHHPQGDGPVVLLHFLAAAILTSPPLCDPINNHRANLQSYVRSFDEKGSTDLLMGIQKRVELRRHYTLDAIDIGIANGLLVWDIPRARLYSRKVTQKLSRGCALVRNRTCISPFAGECPIH